MCAKVNNGLTKLGGTDPTPPVADASTLKTGQKDKYYFGDQRTRGR